MSNYPSHFSSELLLTILSQATTATAIHSTDEMIIETANDAMIAVWGKDKSVIGKPIEEALPELKGQPFLGLLQSVLHTGQTIAGSDTRADLVVDGELKPFYFDFEYRAIKNDEGEVICILHTATDVTARYLSRRREMELESELQAANQELAATNEELAAANEELAAANEEMSSSNEELASTLEQLTVTNEELAESQEILKKLNYSLAESEARFRAVVTQAPVGVCIISAHDLMIQDVNDAYLKVVGRERASMQNRTIWQAVPEAAAVYAPIMNKVISTGVAFSAIEHELQLVRNGLTQSAFVNFVYEPVRFEDNSVKAIMIVAVDVTEQVEARRQIEAAEEMLRQAIDSANMGTWMVDLATDKLTISEQAEKIHGVTQGAEMTFTAALNLVAPEHTQKVSNAIEQAIKTKNSFETEYIINPLDGSRPRWLKTTGRAYYDDQDKPVSVSGTMIDITESKAYDQQKDDFISIASHELKTPVTSLKAALQLLDRMKANPSPQVLPKLIEQSNRSMDKISTLIEDLLNLSRMNEGQLKLDKTKFTIAHMLNQCCNHVRVAGKHELILQGDEKLEVKADEHRVDQVIVNMVNNAVKYAPNSKQIVFNVEKVGNMARISVKDTGPGIAPDKIVHLFERYYRTDASGYQNSGLGLGLYISAEIIRKHGGEIGVDSELGKGSTFWFTLPL
ncbi:PAS domain-containing protein [Mucilaginibacter rigui]|uniref:histidine kinase n=1 Tax=Mucilaginibacter rigui TaxID=534635 RepID=A0ABR7X3Q5_9SPHI|nr:ATP-binding protein [Mucilaginibacter rigui]MBD1384422.1 PAS domain-containing protein [Mucilaginibacter rigui]